MDRDSNFFTANQSASLMSRPEDELGRGMKLAAILEKTEIEIYRLERENARLR